MNQIYYNILFLLLVTPLLAAGYTNDKMKGKYTKEKSLNKEFTVTNDALLKISNDYGNLDITAWNEDKIVIEVSIKVNGDDEEKVIEKLKDINVIFEASSTLVSAKTTFDKNDTSWWNKITDGWNGNNLKMEINYIVKVPVTNQVDLNNDYGSITLDKIKGKAAIHCDYGQIIIGELLGNDNYINIDYTNNSTIEYIKNGKIDADYSSFTVTDSEEISLNADYTKSQFGTVKKLLYNCDYGGLKIEKGGVIKGNGDYLGTKIGDITKELNIDSDYGSIHITNLKSTTSQLDINADYTSVHIGYESSFNFNFNIKTSYGGIKLDEENVMLMKKSKDNFKKHYQGYHGSKDSGSLLQINTSYGSVKLTEN